MSDYPFMHGAVIGKWKGIQQGEYEGHEYTTIGIEPENSGVFGNNWFFPVDKSILSKEDMLKNDKAYKDEMVKLTGRLEKFKGSLKFRVTGIELYKQTK